MGLGTEEALVLTLVPLPKGSSYWSQGSLDEAGEAHKRTAAQSGGAANASVSWIPTVAQDFFFGKHPHQGCDLSSIFLYVFPKLKEGTGSLALEELLVTSEDHKGGCCSSVNIMFCRINKYINEGTHWFIRHLIQIKLFTLELQNLSWFPNVLKVPRFVLKHLPLILKTSAFIRSSLLRLPLYKP